jgi:hypothetical protein
LAALSPSLGRWRAEAAAPLPTDITINPEFGVLLAVQAQSGERRRGVPPPPCRFLSRCAATFRGVGDGSTAPQMTYR